MAKPLHEQSMSIATNPWNKRALRLYTEESPLVAEVTVDQPEEIGRRFVACWNACLGVPTKELEARGKKGKTSDPAAHVIKSAEG